MRDPREASAIAVANRRARAAVKAGIASGVRDPLDVARTAWDTADSPEASLRMTEFLESMRGIGPAKVDRILESLSIHPRKRLGYLGRRQIEALGEWLRSRPATVGVDIATGKLIVVAGPTAVGKGTVVTRIRDLHPEVQFSVSATTRAPRPGEVDGVHYFFVSDDEFDALVSSGQMLEWALVHGQNRYGTPRKPIDEALRSGHSIILEIDIQGARQVKQAMPEAVLVFLLPPSWDELVRRLTTRGTESPEEQARRLETAKVEFEAQYEFDETIVNDDVDTAAEAVVSLMSIE
ncbi:MAG: guanylate kinase [Microbacteriaceae bacterium]